MDIDQRLASVLGHETTTPAGEPLSRQGRCRRRLCLNEASNAALRAPTPVKELLKDRQIPRLTV